MKKINVITRNEDIDPARVTDKVVVVINTLFSASAIVHALAHGAEAVHVQSCLQSTRQTVSGLSQDRRVVTEPANAEGRAPFPNHYALELDNSALKGTSLALTCRATGEALYLAGTATHLYVAALLNAPAMAARLLEHEDTRFELICTGPGGRPNLIDLYTAGYLVEHLMQDGPDTWICSDSAHMARAVYLQYREQPQRCLDNSLAGTLIANKALAATANAICDVGRHDIVAHFYDGAVVNSQHLQWAPAYQNSRFQHHGL